MKFPLITFAVLSMSVLIGCGTESTPTEDNSQDSTKTQTAETTSQTTETADKQTNSGVTYRIGTMSTYPPFATVDEYGKPDGFDIDIIKAIATERGFNVEFLAHPWDDWKDDLASNKVDVWVAGIAIKDERKEFATFTDTYMPDATAILTRADEMSQAITQENLTNYKVGVEKGSPAVQIAEDLTGNAEKVEIFDTNYKAFEGLLQKKIDAIVGNENSLGYLSKSFPEFKFLSQSIKSESGELKQLGFMVQKGQTEMANELNEGLKAIKANGEFDKIKQKWFGNLSD